MLIDIVEWYNKEKKEFLRWIWEQAVLNLATQCDTKKIFAFLKNVWIKPFKKYYDIIYT